MAKFSNQKIWRPKASFTTFLKCWTLEYEFTHVLKFIKLFQKRKFYSILILKVKFEISTLKEWNTEEVLILKNEIMRVK